MLLKKRWIITHFYDVTRLNFLRHFVQQYFQYLVSNRQMAIVNYRVASLTKIFKIVLRKNVLQNKDPSLRFYS